MDVATTSAAELVYILGTGTMEVELGYKVTDIELIRGCCGQ